MDLDVGLYSRGTADRTFCIRHNTYWRKMEVEWDCTSSFQEGLRLG